MRKESGHHITADQESKVCSGFGKVRTGTACPYLVVEQGKIFGEQFSCLKGTREAVKGIAQIIKDKPSFEFRKGMPEGYCSGHPNFKINKK